MFSGKVISAGQMKPVKANQSAVVKDILKKGGSDVLRKDIDQKRFWSAMRKDSQSRAYGEQGYTKGNLENFFAKMLNDKNDTFTDNKVKKLMKTMDVNESKVVNRAAELRNETRKAKRQQMHAEREQMQQKEQQKIDSVRKQAEVRPIPTQMFHQPEHFDKYELEYKKQHERKIPQLKTFSVPQQIPTLTAIPRPTVIEKMHPKDERVVETSVKLFGKSQSKIEEAAKAKQLIHEINDPEDYKHQDTS